MKSPQMAPAGAASARNHRASGKPTIPIVSRPMVASVRGGVRHRAVYGCVSRDDGADNCSDWSTNPDPNQSANSPPRTAPAEETMRRAGCRADARPDSSANSKTDQRVLTALGNGGRRDADHVFAFYRNIGAVFFHSQQPIGDGDEFSVVALQFRFDHFNSLPGLQAIQVGPGTLSRLSTERAREPEKKQEKQYDPSHSGLLKSNYWTTKTAGN